MDPQQKEEFYELIWAAIIMSVLSFFLISMMTLVFSLAGCASVPSASLPSASPNVAYKYDIKGTVNGVPFDGVGVIPYAQNYDMKIVSRVDVDLLTIGSCHRDIDVESAIQLGWFDSKRGYNYKFIPNSIESSNSCLVRFGAYNQANSVQNSWGIIDFETPDRTLPAINVCNALTVNSNGVSICQSRIGLIQQIVFPVQVRQDPNISPACKFSTSDNLTWQYKMPSGECVIEFQELGEAHRLHRHTTVGYVQIPIRGN